jgi:hypothetical protein
MIPSPASLPSRERFSALIRFLQVALILAVVLAALGVFVEAAAAAMVGVVIAAPLVRVGWLGLRWSRRGDRRYGAVAAALLGVIFVTGVVAGLVAFGA